MESQSVVQLTLTGNGVRLVENNEAQVAIPGLLREISQLLRIIKDDRPGSAGVPACPRGKGSTPFPVVAQSNVLG